MRYKLTPSLNDGKNDSPSIEVEARDADELFDAVLLDALWGEMTNDHNQPFGVGFTLTIERVA